MTKSIRIPTASFAAGVAAFLCACSDDPKPVSAAPSPAAAPATVAPREFAPPMSAELAARLVRPNSPMLGPAGAPVTVVEVLDPACEACAGFAPIINQLRLLHGDKVRVVVRFAAFHDGSEEAIRILEAARLQGKFEPTLHALFDGQAEWASHRAPNPQRAWELAKASGVDLARARRDAKSAETGAMLRLEAEDITALQVDRTPTIFVNARPLTVFGAEEMFDLVQAEVTRTRQQPVAKE